MVSVLTKTTTTTIQMKTTTTTTSPHNCLVFTFLRLQSALIEALDPTRRLAQLGHHPSWNRAHLRPSHQRHTAACYLSYSFAGHRCRRARPMKVHSCLLLMRMYRYRPSWSPRLPRLQGMFRLFHHPLRFTLILDIAARQVQVPFRR